ncbi:MAG TPA: hypothetical protein VM118_01370 [Acidobacteriota bacterium]|nr:hypothetical protein [Acidobacteriota bacterium]
MVPEKGQNADNYGSRPSPPEHRRMLLLNEWHAPNIEEALAGCQSSLWHLKVNGATISDP